MMNLKAKLKNKKGFTLVELVVVIAVLAILAAIAIPIVTGVVDKANAATDAANAQAYESAFKMLTAELDLKDEDRLAPYKTVAKGDVFAVTALKLASVNNAGKLAAKQSEFAFYYNKETQEVVCKETKSAPAAPYILLESTTPVGHVK